MTNKLLGEALKTQDNLSDISFTVNDTDFKFYFRYLTLLEKVRIEQMCVKPETTINTDGTSTVEHKKQEHLVPIHTILEKALDSDGKRIFTHTNPEDFNTVSNLPAGLASYIAYEMSIDILGTMGKNDGN